MRNKLSTTRRKVEKEDRPSVQAQSNFILVYVTRSENARDTIRIMSPNFEKRCRVVFSTLKLVVTTSVDPISTGKLHFSLVFCYFAENVYG